MNRYLMALFLFLSLHHSVFANTGTFFNLSASGSTANVSLQLCLNAKGPISCQNYSVSALDLSISTTIPNHGYPSAGIKIITPGYTIANIGISCTPLSNGYCAFSVSDGAAQSINLVADATSGLSLSPSSLSQAVYNAAYSVNLVASGGHPPYSYTVTSGSLPAGLSLTSASGLLAGTPTATGIFNFTATVTDSDGATASQGYALTVGPSFSPATLAAATLNAFYDQPVNIGSSGQIYVCSISSGSLPSGVYINQLGACTLSGYPTATGTSSFTITANGGPSVGSNSQNYSITVYPQVPTTSVVSSSSNPSTTGSAVTLSATVSSANGSPTAGFGAGTVLFSANGTTISGCSSQSLNSGVATCTTSTLPAGTNAIVATFSGGAGFAASTSTTFNESVAATLTATVPAAPRYVSATPGNGSVTLSWYPPANTGGESITGYTVNYGTTTSATYTTSGCTTSSASDLSCTVNALTNGTFYTFTVVATNASGTGPLAYSSSVAPGAILTASPANLALSGLGSGASRAITITNNSASNVTIGTISSPTPMLPTGTSISITQANACTSGLALPASGGSCTITIIPDASATSACTTGIAPTPSVMTVTDNNGDTVSANIVVLGYGCQYQEGYLYSINDTTPMTGSIGGKVITLSDQLFSGSQEFGAWSSTLTSIWGVDDTSTIASPSPNASSASPATLAAGQLNCDAVNDGACASRNIFIYFGAGNYAADLCEQTIDGYTDWYLPAVCELGAFGSTGVNPPYPDTVNSQSCSTGSTNIQNELAGTNIVSNFNADTYWSSTEFSGSPAFTAWSQTLSSNGGDGQSYVTKVGSYGVRCSRALTL